MRYRVHRFLSLAVIILTSVCITSRPAAAQYDARILADNPFAYLRLGDIDADEAIDDGTGSGVMATYENVELGADSLVAGETNTAARFNGQDSLIRIADDPQINVTNGPWEERTIELWFSADDTSLETPQVLFEEGGTTRGIAIYILEDELIMGAWNRANDDSGVSSPWVNDEETPDGSLFISRSIASNVTYHAALVMDGDPGGDFAGTLTGYVDGGQFGQRTGVGQMFNHGDDVGIGGMDTNIWLSDGTNPGGDGLYFLGVIDEVAMFDHALSPGRVQIHAGLVIDLPGDFNEDGTIDQADFTVMKGNFHSTGKYPDGDMNFDGSIDLGDFILFRDAFAAAPGTAVAAAVPEPTSGFLLVFGSLFGLIVRRRRQ